MKETVRVVACPSCGKDVEWRPENNWRPFCGERCKLLDLGAWATEQYTFPETEAGDATEADPRHPA